MDSTTIKGFQLLELLTLNGGPCGVSELARETDLTKSNVQRILATLTSLGYVEREPRTSRYVATLKMWEVGNRVLQRDRILRTSTGVMKAMRADVGETMVLCILDGWEVVYIEKQESDNPIRLSCAVGTRLPAFSTATGRTIVAFRDEVEQQAVIDRYSEYHPRQTEDLQRCFRRIREIGFETSLGGYRAGVNSIAAPIRSAGNLTCASLAITGPEERIPSGRFGELAPRLLDAATRISSALGYTGVA